MGKRLWRHISFSSTCFCYYRKHVNDDKKICLLPCSSCFQQHFHDWFYGLRYNSDLPKLEWVIWRVEANFSPFQLLNMLRLIIIYRSSRPEVLCKKGVLRNFTKFTGKHLCQNLFFNKVAGLAWLWHLLAPVAVAQVFSCEFCEISKNIFFIEHLWWLLLNLLGLISHFLNISLKQAQFASFSYLHMYLPL